MSSSISFFSSFGPIAYLLLASSVAIVAIIIERLIIFYSQPKLSKKDYQQIIINLQKGQSLSIQKPKIAIRFRDWLEILAGKTFTLAEAEITLLLTELRNKLQKPLEWLNLFAIAAPMMGLLGTIWSMSHSFAILGKDLNNGNLNKMIEYLSEAMYATAFGIILALVSMLGLYILRQKSDKYLDECELAFNRISLAIQQQGANKHD